MLSLSPRISSVISSSSPSAREIDDRLRIILAALGADFRRLETGRPAGRLKPAASAAAILAAPSSCERDRRLRPLRASSDISWLMSAPSFETDDRRRLVRRLTPAARDSAAAARAAPSSCERLRRRCPLGGRRRGRAGGPSSSPSPIVFLSG